MSHDSRPPNSEGLSLPGFNRARWELLDQATLETPWQIVPHQVRRTSAGLQWRGLSVWHQVGPIEDLYVPPLSSHSILLRRASATQLLQRQGSRMAQGLWRPGEALVVPAGTASFWRSSTARDNIHVNLDPTWLQRASDGRARLTSCFGRGDPVLSSLGQVLLASLDSHSALNPGFAEHMALAIAVHLLENYAEPGATRSATLSRRQTDRLIEAIDAAPADPWPLARLAGLAELSPFHFARAFKATLGTTPHGYVTGRRMEAAAHLLRTTNRPLFEIARATGYRSAAHFTQSFRRHWGTAPSDYRRGN